MNYSRPSPVVVSALKIVSCFLLIAANYPKQILPSYQ